MKYWLIVFSLLAPCAAWADKSAPISYSRTNIMLARHSLPASMPWQQDANALVLDVELRDGMALYSQNGWFDLSGYSEKSGVLMAFKAPGIQPIPRIAHYTPVDILFVDKEGKITQIAPNITLSNLEQEIYPDAPVLAFLFMQGGSCGKLSIAPGDEIEHALFKKPPTILSAPKTAGEAANAPVKPVQEYSLQPPKGKAP